MATTWIWGTVTATGPLAVQLDGDTAALPFTPDSLVDPRALLVNERVRCELSDNHLVIHGVAAGSALQAYPVGSIYMSVSPTSPSTLFGGTWAAWGTGRVPVAVDTSQTEFNTVEKTGGEKTHVLTRGEVPDDQGTRWSWGTSGNVHIPVDAAAGAGSSNNLYTWQNDPAWDANAWTGGGAHNNLQPYITCYMWKRTA